MKKWLLLRFNYLSKKQIEYLFGCGISETELLSLAYPVAIPTVRSMVESSDSLEDLSLVNGRAVGVISHGGGIYMVCSMDGMPHVIDTVRSSVDTCAEMETLVSGNAIGVVWGNGHIKGILESSAHLRTAGTVPSGIDASDTLDVLASLHQCGVVPSAIDARSMMETEVLLESAGVEYTMIYTEIISSMEAGGTVEAPDDIEMVTEILDFMEAMGTAETPDVIMMETSGEMFSTCFAELIGLVESCGTIEMESSTDATPRVIGAVYACCSSETSMETCVGGIVAEAERNWEYPVQNGDILTITQAYSTLNGNKLEVE